MTHDELMKLPDVSPSVDSQEGEINGKLVFVPVQVGEAGALLTREGDGLFLDRNGDEWIVGWLKGQRVRKRSSAWRSSGIHLE